MAKLQHEWEANYQTGQLPWDSGLRSRELARVLTEAKLAPCKAADLGCGTGTNAIFLAQQGFTVTGLDFSSTAIELAQQKAAAANAPVQFFVADLVHLKLDLEPFDFLFDRGCYHCVRRDNLAGYLDTLKQLSRPGTRYLTLAGNANEQTDPPGPPRVHEHEIRQELGELFDIEFIREFRFEDAGGVDGPLGWSCWMTRR